MTQLNNLLSFFIMGILMLGACHSSAQKPLMDDLTSNPAFDQTIRSLLSFDIPVVTVRDFAEDFESYLILDTRSREEFDISHIEGARFVGYKEFDEKMVEDVSKDSKILVYCSIGYRSEKIGEKLQSLGYTQIYNLYGSIFEWVNQQNPIVDSNNRETRQLHTYNRKWSRWVQRDSIQKTW